MKYKGKINFSWSFANYDLLMKWWYLETVDSDTSRNVSRYANRSVHSGRRAGPTYRSQGHWSMELL